MFTSERRNELFRAAQVKAIRVAIFEVGYAAVFLFGVNKAAELWPEYRSMPLVMAVIVFMALYYVRYLDWKAMARLEELLDKDLAKREPRGDVTGIA
jgi:hypothetical protein